MDFDKLMTALTNVQSPVWVNGRKVGTTPDTKLEKWEYTATVPGIGNVMAVGVSSNNVKEKLKHASVWVDGRPVKLDSMQYLDLLGQLGYLYSVVQPARIKQNGMSK